MQVFECARCGSCCKSFKVEDKEKYPIFIPDSNILSLSAPRLFLFDWEKKSFPKDSIFPGFALFDLKSNRTIILNYNTSTDICPNLKNDLCSIHENKPISCWLYPCPFRDADSFLPTQSAFGVCKAELPPEQLNSLLDPTNSTKDELRKKFYLRYGDGFIKGLVSSILLENYMKFIATLEKQGIIKLAKEGYQLEFLKKRIDLAQTIDISELFYEYNKYHLHEMLLSKQGIEKIKEKISKN